MIHQGAKLVEEVKLPLNLLWGDGTMEMMKLNPTRILDLLHTPSRHTYCQVVQCLLYFICFNMYVEEISSYFFTCVLQSKEMLICGELLSPSPSLKLTHQRG